MQPITKLGTINVLRGLFRPRRALIVPNFVIGCILLLLILIILDFLVGCFVMAVGAD